MLIGLSKYQSEATYLFSHQYRSWSQRDRLERLARHVRQSLLSPAFDLAKESPGSLGLVGTFTADVNEREWFFSRAQLLESPRCSQGVIVGDSSVSVYYRSLGTY